MVVPSSSLNISNKDARFSQFNIVKQWSSDIVKFWMCQPLNGTGSTCALYTLHINPRPFHRQYMHDPLKGSSPEELFPDHGAHYGDNDGHPERQWVCCRLFAAGPGGVVVVVCQDHGGGEYVCNIDSQ